MSSKGVAHTPYCCHKNQEIIVILNLIYLVLTSFVGKRKSFWSRIQPGLDVALNLSGVFSLPVVGKRAHALGSCDVY